MKEINKPAIPSKYKYITNAYTELPHGSASDITASPAWQSLKRGKDMNTLTAAQALLFQVPRPAEELYDLKNDPYELDNLIGDPAYTHIADSLKIGLSAWQRETGDFTPAERLRKDNVDRISGIKFDQTRLPPRP